jgi:glyoxylase-like metal-dependent hydrolase (beta-lactamase superfamily II)
MRVTLLKKSPDVYSCNVYLIRGDWNKMDDINTLIDTGTDGFIIDELNNISTGVGKKRVEQVIITHEHFDHSAGLKWIIKEFNPLVFAYSDLGIGNSILRDGMFLKTGDKSSMIIHTPGHSHDSVCLYNQEDQVLFSGDTTVDIKFEGGTYTRSYVEALDRLTKLKISTIYRGHDDPITENAEEILKFSLRNVIKSEIID